MLQLLECCIRKPVKGLAMTVFYVYKHSEINDV